MGLIVRTVQYTYVPMLEVETMVGTKFRLEQTEDGGLVVKSDNEMLAESGKPHEVTVRQVKSEKEEWKEPRAI